MSSLTTSILLASVVALGDDVANPPSAPGTLEAQLKREDPKSLSEDARRLGDGAAVRSPFISPPSGVRCHLEEEPGMPTRLGPDLTAPRTDFPGLGAGRVDPRSVEDDQKRDTRPSRFSSRTDGPRSACWPKTTRRARSYCATRGRAEYRSRSPKASPKSTAITDRRSCQVGWWSRWLTPCWAPFRISVLSY